MSTQIQIQSGGTQVGYRGFKYNVKSQVMAPGAPVPPFPVPANGEAIYTFQYDEDGDFFRGISISVVDANGVNITNIVHKINDNPVTITYPNGTYTIIRGVSFGNFTVYSTHVTLFTTDAWLGAYPVPENNSYIDFNIGNPTLVSGTNIKTVNGTSVLGSGNIATGFGGFSYTSYFASFTPFPPPSGEAYVFYSEGDPYVMHISYTTQDGIGMQEYFINNKVGGNAIIITNSTGQTSILTQVGYAQDFGTYCKFTMGPYITGIDPSSFSGQVYKWTFDQNPNLGTINGTSLYSGGITVQPTLVSGTNIKTINSTSLLGSGDITISASTSAITNGKKGFSYFNDFVSNGASSYEDQGIVAINGANAAIVNPFPVPRSATTLGVIGYTSNFQANGYAMHIGAISNEGSPSPHQLTFGNGLVNFESLILTSLSTSTNRFRTIHGFGSNQVNSSDSDGAFFTYDEGGTSNGTPASPNWQCITTTGNVRTLTTTTTTVTGVWTKLRIEGNAAGTSVAFYINNTLVATHTTNIPNVTSTRYFAVKQGLFNTIGNTINRTLYCDYLGYEIILTTPRT